MQNFTFKIPTKIIFGQETENQVGAEVLPYAKKVLLHYGGGSIKKSGLYDRVMASLKASGIQVYELAGVQPNPRLSLVHEGIRICRANDISFILAVGGGSVIDSAKAIAVGVPYEGDVWDFFAGKSTIKTSLKVGTILTLPAAGSESSDSAVITNEDVWMKVGNVHPLYSPVFSILNPELTTTLPKIQTANGVADIMSHVMERYFTNTPHVELTDRLCEGVFKTVVRNALRVLQDTEDYNARAEIMWSGTIAHNNLLNTGRLGDWGTHTIEHELSAFYDIAHGTGLAILFPAWIKYVYQRDLQRFAQFAERMWNIDTNLFDLEESALLGIRSLEQFFTELGLPTRLSHININQSRFDEIASRATAGGTRLVGDVMQLNKEEVLKVLELAI